MARKNRFRDFAKKFAKFDYEKAALEVPESIYDNLTIPIDGEMTQIELNRANVLLDRNKDKLFSDLMSIRNITDMEKTTLCYTADYLMDLPLSLDSLRELVATLMQQCAKYHVSPPQAWIDITNGQFFEFVSDNPEDEKPKRRLSETV